MQREFFRQFLAIHMLIVHFTVMMLRSSVTTGKNRRPTFQWHNREFSDAYSTFWYCNLTFPDYNGESTALLYLAFDDITTVIFTIVTGSWTLFFQWQPGFLQWTGNFSCSVLLLKSGITFWHGTKAKFESIPYWQTNSKPGKS